MARCYRPAFCDAYARAMMLAQLGAEFDSRVTDAFLAAWARFVSLRLEVTQGRMGFSNRVRNSDNAWTL